jgi:GMP synthase-like glutamine amidotransferase
MRVHVLQHVPFEGLGSIEPWLSSRRATIAYTRLFAADRLPDLDEVDLLIAMGGPMSVNDESELPWLKPEKQVLRDAIGREIPVLGVCLGAQLIASALGAPVYRNPAKEIGWFPVQSVAPGDAMLRLPGNPLVFHWHGDTFDLPPGAVRIAGSPGCANQAFQLKTSVIGLQFHLEVTRQGVEAMIENCRNELIPGPYVQTAAQMLEVPAECYARINVLMDDLLGRLAAKQDRG